MKRKGSTLINRGEAGKDVSGDKIYGTCVTDVVMHFLPFKKFLLNKFPWIEQFLSFGIVGFFNTLIAYVTYAVVVSFNIHPQIAGIAGFITSVTNAWLMNKYWVFKDNNITFILLILFLIFTK